MIIVVVVVGFQGGFCCYVRRKNCRALRAEVEEGTSCQPLCSRIDYLTGYTGRKAELWKAEGDCYYKPGLLSRKRWGDSDVDWSVQTAVGQGFLIIYPVVS